MTVWTGENYVVSWRDRSRPARGGSGCVQAIQTRPANRTVPGGDKPSS